jgi:tRNA pseudouridine38-40 synthase
MKAEARTVLGEHDFAAFRSTHDTRQNTVRSVFRCDVEKHADTMAGCLDIVVEGNRFMYNMVRIIAGTLVDIGRGKLQPGACIRAFQSKDRRDLGMTAPAKGLMLEYVKLATSLEAPWPADHPQQ